MDSSLRVASFVLGLLISGAAFAAAEPAGPELIRNGDFEQPFGANGVAPHWTDNSGWAPVTVSYADEAAAAHAGGHAQRITCSSFKGGAVQFVQYAVPVTNGIVYRVSLWMKGDLAAPVEVQLRKSPAPYTTYASHLFRVGPQWKQFQFDAAPVETDPAAMFIIRFGATGTVAVDDVSCRAVGTRSRAVRLRPPAEPIPATYFGFHLHRNNSQTTWPAAPFGAIRLWDAHVSWPQLEPERGHWEFAGLDWYLDQAAQHGAEVLLPLGLTPTWASARPDEKSAYNGANVSKDTGWAAPPRDLADWDNYVRAVATHCQGKVRAYEIWNEPNETGFFTGTPDQLVELTKRAAKIVREVDPRCQVVSPGIVGSVMYLEDFIAKGGTAPADVIGFHFYVWPDPPEKMVPEILRVEELLRDQKLANRPLWDTEAGWDIESAVNPPPLSAHGGRTPLTMSAAGDYVARAFILNWAAGVRRYYYYAWDDGLMGLVERDGTLKPPARAYEEVHHWLLGARMESCEADEAGTWTVRLKQASGAPGVIVWNAKAELDFTPPATWRVGAVRNWLGKSTPVRAGGSIRVTASPVLLE